MLFDNRKIYVSGNDISYLQGHLNTYRFCDNVWTFVLNDVEFKNGDIADKVKVVAVDGKSSAVPNASQD